EEDFGIVPLEAQSCGCPVIAYDRGGATETVVPLHADHPTGLLFPEQSVPSLIHAIEEFESVQSAITPAACRQNAFPFSRARFLRELSQYVTDVVQGRPTSLRKVA
ncbi:MAG: glycosyltransferase, partial [Gemmataceae bacterium]